MAAAIVLAATLTACGGSDGNSADSDHPKMPGISFPPGVDQTPDDASSDTPVTDPTTTRPTSGKIGDTLVLEGSPGTTAGTVLVDITLDTYEDHAQPTLDVFAAATGKRLVAAQFTIASKGDTAYVDSTGVLGAKVVDDQGQAYRAKPGQVTSGSSFPLILSVQPGQKATGWVVFDVPQDAKITGVQYSMDPIGDSFGDSKPEGHGRWSLN
ncbi:DUF4352 domain-containing protein [Wenjunlia vitaminophila]|uniref:DUF4352 domain-containing protein n=1 Tax=Wenjunlia vitaminophila TaxID=76728 RepID=UPI001F3D7161|nr:DUF4352 domain-containing protein [Wenjunlia vitaminophila]